MEKWNHSIRLKERGWSSDGEKTLLLPLLFETLRRPSSIIPLSLILYGFSLPAILARMYFLEDSDSIMLGSGDYFALLLAFVSYGELFVIVTVNIFYVALKRPGKLCHDSLSGLLASSTCLRRIVTGALCLAAVAATLSFRSWYDSPVPSVILAIMSVIVPVCLLCESQYGGFTRQESDSEHESQYQISVIVWAVCCASASLAIFWAGFPAWPPYAPGFAKASLALLFVILAVCFIVMWSLFHPRRQLCQIPAEMSGQKSE